MNNTNLSFPHNQSNKHLTHWCLVTLHGDIDPDEYWLSNGLLYRGTKPLPEPMLSPLTIILLKYPRDQWVGNTNLPWSLPHNHSYNHFSWPVYKHIHLSGQFWLQGVLQGHQHSSGQTSWENNIPLTINDKGVNHSRLINSPGLVAGGGIQSPTPWSSTEFHATTIPLTLTHVPHQGVVSLTFCKLSKIFSRNLCVAEIALPTSISSWNFVRVPKAMLWAHVQSFSLKFSP